MQSPIEYQLLLVTRCDQLVRLKEIVSEFSPLLSATLRLVSDPRAADRDGDRWFRFGVAPVWRENPELAIADISLELRDNQTGSLDVRYLVKDSDGAFAIRLRDADIDQRILTLRIQCQPQMQSATEGHQALLQQFVKSEGHITDLKAVDVGVLTPAERHTLFCENIKVSAQALFDADAIEVRLLEEDGVLIPLYNYGLTDAAAVRPLCRHVQSNSIAGYVAFWSCSYLCVDTENDPLYLEGIQNARSAMTVPIVWDDKTIGTLNVERVSSERYAYADLKLLELFADKIATGLNQLEVVDAQRQLTANEAVRLYDEELRPALDTVLLNTLHALECLGDRESAAESMLRCTLTTVRSLRNSLRDCERRLCGENTADKTTGRTQLSDKVVRDQRILVVDGDEDVRRSARRLLGPLGAIVETATTAKEAVLMVKHLECGCAYDAVIAAKHLPDSDCLQLMLELQSLVNPLPFVVSRPFHVYEPSNLIVKARMVGLKPGATTFVPFRLPQLLNAIEAAK